MPSALEPPAQLPFLGYDDAGHLSVSSIRLFMRDPYKWRRRYLDRDYEPSSPALVVGTAVGRAEGASFQTLISDGYRLTTGDVLDCYSDEFELKVDRESQRGGVDWEDERPGKVKDSGAQALARYHRDIAPRVRPLSVERHFQVQIPHVDWTFEGYMDLEALIGRRMGVDDYKARTHTRGPVSASEAASELQPTGYLFAKRTEDPLGFADPEAGWGRSAFRYHSLVRPRTGRARPRDVSITPTDRTDEQLDTFLALLYSVATEMAWRVENDVWRGALPGDPLCSPKFCGFFATCPYGGAHRPPLQLGPRPVRRPHPDDVLEAVKMTARKDRTTTAARVGAHLGVSAISAGNSLAALQRHGALERKLVRRKGSRPHWAYTPSHGSRLARDLEQTLAPPTQEVLAP